MTLFQLGNFTLHSGEQSDFKIDCDALTEADWECLTVMARKIIGSQYGDIVPVPRGGVKWWEILSDFPHSGGPRLIVDDVLTTGRSMRETMTRPNDVGLVVFARGPLPPRVTALFAMPAVKP